MTAVGLKANFWVYLIWLWLVILEGLEQISDDCWIDIVYRISGARPAVSLPVVVNCGSSIRVIVQ